jgi:DNA-binding transcriptional LysR family regulator
MNLTQVKYFHAICRFQNLSDAAVYLFVSQPTLSCAVKELEKEFGVALFLRHHHGVTLTPEGEIFFRATKDLLKQAEQIEATMKDLGVARKTLRLGVPPMIGSMLLPRIYRGFSPLHPDIKLDITECGRNELCKKLDEGELDMLFLPHSKPLEPPLAFTEVAQLEIVCCTTAQSPLAGQSFVIPEDLADTPVVLFENSFFQTDEIKKWFAAHKITPQILLQTNQLSTMMSVISGGAAVGFAFRELLFAHPHLVPLPLQDPIRPRVSLVWQKNGFFFSAMKKFKDYIEHGQISLAGE